jgi:hypothetical protein
MLFYFNPELAFGNWYSLGSHMEGVLFRTDIEAT